MINAAHESQKENWKFLGCSRLPHGLNLAESQKENWKSATPACRRRRAASRNLKKRIESIHLFPGILEDICSWISKRELKVTLIKSPPAIQEQNLKKRIERRLPAAEHRDKGRPESQKENWKYIMKPSPSHISLPWISKRELKDYLAEAFISFELG